MPNRLAQQTSPYLLQHANNPVDWRPWGPQAFDEARARGVPIFLSIGYSTCYWCHVMERESFEHGPTARLMNDSFVCIKVDREERPDVDDLYMAATQVMTGRGGWPMSVFLEPDGLWPFYCGTYFPLEPRHGLVSFRQVLGGMASAWAERRADVLAQAQRLADAVREHLQGRQSPVTIGADDVSAAASALLRSHDRDHGGFANAPKFPQPVYLELLLDVLDVAADPATSASIESALRLTLDRMALGGLFDQIGGGFHRYCVDETWTVPHFEKMLYDNAQLVSVYTRASARLADPFYATVAARAIDYVLREMTAPDGAFYSAQDAEVDHREGLNYLWTPDEFAAVLGPDDAPWAARVYGLDAGPNFRDPHHPADGPKSVPRLEERPDGPALLRLERVNAQLLQARGRRKQPHLDDKVLSAWNGMMIQALATAGDALGQPGYLHAARRAASAVLARLRGPDGRLARSSREGRAVGGGLFEDSAWMIAGLSALAGSDPGGPWLTQAKRLLELADADYADGAGGYFDTAADRSDLFLRARTTYDGATPSGGGVLLHALVRLDELEPGSGWLDRATALVASLSPAIAASPIASANATRGLLRLLRRGPQAAARLDLGPRPPDPWASQSPRPDFTPVEVYADAERVQVGPGEHPAPAVFGLVLRIAEGYHILAAEPHADPGSDLPAGLVGLRVGLVSGEGVAVYAEYPRGEPFEGAQGPPIMVHTGSVELRVVLERAPGVGVGPGRPILGVTFQACTDRACLEPMTVELGVAVDLD